MTRDAEATPPVTASTYFDATFCSMFAGSPLERLLTIDDGLALSVANTYVPLKNQVLCIVNSTKYGGSGGSVATCSVDPQANEIAIHEIGHSAFLLADEYGGNGSGTPAGEPGQPNVTRDTNRTTNKWRALIAPTTPMPSACDATCASSTCTPPATPPAAGAVGTYEGAIYSDCNTYRPLPSCYMRDYAPFCPVCAGVIRAVLQPFQPAESITLVTPSVQFTNVPSGMGGVGVTTHRAIRWDVVTCRNLTFQITRGSDWRIRNPVRDFGGGLRRPDCSSRGRAYLALVYVDQPRRRRQWQRHRPVRGDRRILGHHHQRQHRRTSTHGGVSRARSIRQHE